MTPRILEAARLFETQGKPRVPEADDHASSYYVAGIDLSGDDYYKSVREKTSLLTDMIPHVMEDAKHACGNKVIVIIALCEYALTYRAISAKEKNDSVAALQSVVNNNDNLILIPGSYAVVEQSNDKTRHAGKIKKMKDNYALMTVNRDVAADWGFVADKEVMESAELDTCILLQNCTYLISAAEKIKHKKTFPYYEEERVRDRKKEDNRVFYIGADTPLKKVHAAGKVIDAGISICRDITNPLQKQELRKDPPLLHVIVSSPLAHRVGYCYGALNVHIDSQLQLAVAINNGHARRKEIKAVKAALYRTNTNDKQAIKIIEFSEIIEPEILLQPKTPGI